MPDRFYLCSHTHWDREWYRSSEQVRIRLVQMFDGLLRILQTDPEFRKFNFDGQTIVIEDYLEIRPENEDKQGFILRFWNGSDKSSDARISLFMQPKRVCISNIKEEVIKEIPASQILEIPVDAKKIVSIRLEFE